jgi:hypothetical protein
MLSLLGVMLWACSDQAKDEKPVGGAIPQHQLQAMEEAKAVEDKLKQADAERRAQANEDAEPE